MGSYFIARFGRLLVNHDEVVLHGQLNFVARGIRQAVHQKLIDPQQGLLGVYRNGVVLKEPMLSVYMIMFVFQDGVLCFLFFARKSICLYHSIDPMRVSQNVKKCSFSGYKRQNTHLLLLR
jgi:hypothetical protein